MITRGTLPCAAACNSIRLLPLYPIHADRSTSLRFLQDQRRKHVQIQDTGPQPHSTPSPDGRSSSRSSPVRPWQQLHVLPYPPLLLIRNASLVCLFVCGPLDPGPSWLDPAPKKSSFLFAGQGSQPDSGTNCTPPPSNSPSTTALLWLGCSPMHRLFVSGPLDAVPSWPNYAPESSSRFALVIIICFLLALFLSILSFCILFLIILFFCALLLSA